MTTATTRRGALRQLGALAGSAVALGTARPVAAAAPTTESAPVATPVRDTRIILGTNWRTRCPGVAAWELAPLGSARLPSGDLTTTDGTPIGAYTSELAPALLGVDQVHHIDLGDGTLTAGGAQVGDAGVLTVLSGTGRYVGATGTYTLHQQPAIHGGTARIHLDITLGNEPEGL